MAWNEPGGSGNKDPWGNRNNQGPPDLDEFVRKLQSKLAGLFGGKGGSGSGGGSSASGGNAGSISLGVIAAVLVGIWALSGIYIVDQGKEGVVLQFGAFSSITDPGPHWYPRFIDTVDVVDVANVRSVNIGRTSDEALMLTEDENIIDIKFTVQYKVKDARDYLFSVRDPDLTLRQVTESAVREIVGKNTLDYIITDGRVVVSADIGRLIQKILNSYSTGITVVNLNMQNAQPPEQVQHAFDDAIKAREDKQRRINEAEAYSNGVLPRARGGAARIIQEAKGYQAQVVARAEGETDRFLMVLRQYKKAPKVTRERLYLDTMEKVMANSRKVVVDVKNSNNLMYLPLDKMIKSQPSVVESDASSGSTSPPAITRRKPPSSTRDSRFSGRLRSREVR
ncbi:MAG TPA: FtsH protease activity modulator HflK [Gammaproteobacteria bacterium]|nr:FtsH protease activity modulator HflK [Gammaproteobacteria bacterium]